MALQPEILNEASAFEERTHPAVLAAREIRTRFKAKYPNASAPPLERALSRTLYTTMAQVETMDDEVRRLTDALARATMERDAAIEELSGLGALLEPPEAPVG